MTQESYQSLLTELSQTKKQKDNWYLIALLVDRIKKGLDGPQQAAKRLKDASEVSGYSINTINRMLAVKVFFDSVMEEIPEIAGVDANTLSFPSLEVVKRLHQLDSKKGVSMFVDVAKGKVTFRELREYYNREIAGNPTVASAHQVARLEARDFEDAVLQAVRFSADILFEDVTNLSISTKRSFPLSVDAVVYTQGSQNPIAGLEFIFLRNQENYNFNLDVLLQRSLFSSGFFQRYWVIFASITGKERINRFCRIIDELDRVSIGVAVVAWEVGGIKTTEHLQIIRMPTGDPYPDWRNRLDIFKNPST